MKATAYDVTVIVPTYNRVKLLGYTLDSLVRQSFEPHRFEVIVVDDGSSDNSAELVMEYDHKLNIKYFFQEDKGYRVASARNIGLAHAQGEVIMFIDSGVLLGSDTVKSHWDFHWSKPGMSAVIGYVYGFDQNDHQTRELIQAIDCKYPDETIQYFRTTGQFADLRELAYAQYGDDIHNMLAPWIFFWTCNLSIRKQSIDANGSFDTNFDLRWGAEDQDLGLRLFKSGVNIYLNRDAVAIHYPHYKDEMKNLADDLENRKYLHQKHQIIETQLYLTFNDFEIHEELNAYYQAAATQDSAPLPVQNSFVE
jgi:glycosyltransferase involved in cell wall biosynthesis